jgi:hypothetical protein
MIELLKPGTTLVRSVPVGVTYGFTTRKSILQTDLPSIARGQLNSLKNEKLASTRMTDRMRNTYKI